MNHKFELNEELYFSNSANETQTSETELAYKFNLKSGFNGMAAFTSSYENIDKEFNLSEDVSVPAGKYNFLQFQTHLHTSSSKRLMINLDAYAGGFYDGNRFTVGLEPVWNIGSSLQLSLAYEYNHVKFPERNQDFTGNIARFRTQIMFTTALSVSAFVQYNSVENNFSSNVRFRYNPREGNDFYIVFNEERNTYRSIEDPGFRYLTTGLSF